MAGSAAPGWQPAADQGAAMTPERFWRHLDAVLGGQLCCGLGAGRLQVVMGPPSQSDTSLGMATDHTVVLDQARNETLDLIDLQPKHPASGTGRAPRHASNTHRFQDRPLPRSGLIVRAD